MDVIDNEEEINYREAKDSLVEYGNKHETIMDEAGLRFAKRIIINYWGQEISEEKTEKIIRKTLRKVKNETYQAMEALIHNLNSMHSRAGSQVPFSSLNYGTCTSPEGRLIIESILLATEAGLGNGETPIFPIQIFKLKAGVSLNPDDPNYDMFRLACRVSAKRLFPNFSNLDAPYNAKYYVPGDIRTEVAYMGCRTRVIGNNFDPNNQIVTGRGNLSFTSINLPRLAIKANGVQKDFFQELDKMLELVADQLLERYKIICRKHPKNFPFLFGQGIWIESGKLQPYDDISEVLKHGTMSIGFIGLAETLTALTGKHHGESEKSQKLGLKIIKRIRNFCTEKSKEYQMNFTCLATPAEGLSDRFLKIDREKFGTITGVTDKEYYTNSFHIPVSFNISYYEKLEIEAPYHELTDAGHISYIELDGDPSKNLDAFEKIIRTMHKLNIGYGAINHPVDTDPICGYTGIIDDKCPRCGRKDGEAMTEEQWDKIHGYTRDDVSQKWYNYHLGDISNT